MDDVDTALAGWATARRYGMPASMVERATGRRLAGDWRGACAAAGVDVRFDLAEVRDRYGAEVAGRVEADLVRLAPDLVRWHAPRWESDPHGQLMPNLLIALASYGDGLRLFVRTPAYIEAPQRLSIHCAVHTASVDRPNAPAVEDWTSARYLWDAGAAHLLTDLFGGGRTPFHRRDGQRLTDTELAAPDADDAVSITEQVILRQDAGDVERAWRSGGVRPDLSGPWRELWAAVETERVLLTAMVPALARSARAMLTGPASPKAVLLRHSPMSVRPALAVSLDGDGHLRARPLYEDDSWDHPMVPPALWRRLPDLELLRTGRISAAQLHPLVRAAMFPDQPDLGYHPLRPTVDDVRRDLPAVLVHGDTGTLIRMLDGGLDPASLVDVVRSRGPLDYLARMDDQIGLLARLLDAGLDLNARDALGRTPLANVLYDGAPATLVRAMLDAGADPVARDSAGQTMLHVMHSYDSDRIVGWLVDAGLDPNATDQYGDPPLLTLIRTAPVEALRALLAAGAVPAPADRNGFDVVAFVANSGRDDLDFLVHGADQPLEGPRGAAT